MYPLNHCTSKQRQEVAVSAQPLYTETSGCYIRLANVQVHRGQRLLYLLSHCKQRPKVSVSAQPLYKYTEAKRCCIRSTTV
jgi:hypothetical protein